MNKKIDEMCNKTGISGIYTTSVNSDEIRSIKKITDLTDLEKIFSKVKKFKQLLNENCSDLTEFSINYKSIRIIVRLLSEQRLLIVFTDFSVNIKTISKFLNGLLTVLDKPALKSEKPKKRIEEIEMTNMETIDGISQNMDSNIPDEELEAIYQSVVKVMGPVASMIIDDALKKWKKSGRSQEDQLLDLIEIIRNDIEEKELIEKFDRTLKQYSTAS